MLYLHGIGHFHPETIITNQFLEELDIGSSEDWILERVGIRERRTVLPLEYIRETKNKNPGEAVEASRYTNAETASRAARMAIERAGIGLADIGLVISGSSAPEHVTPAEAASVAATLNIDVPCFDINSACSTFGMQLSLLGNMSPESLPPYILVVTPENLTRVIDYSDRKTAPLFGDGTSAAVVSVSEPSSREFVLGHYDSNPLSWKKVCVPRVGHFSQDGSAVQGFAIRRTTICLRALQERFPVNGNRFKFIGHQANLGMLKTVCQRCDITEENHWFNVDEYGNTGGAGAPCVISQNWEKFAPGQHLGIVVVGGGLTWVHMMLKINGG